MGGLVFNRILVFSLGQSKHLKVCHKSLNKYEMNEKPVSLTCKKNKGTLVNFLSQALQFISVEVYMYASRHCKTIFTPKPLTLNYDQTHHSIKAFCSPSPLKQPPSRLHVMKGFSTSESQQECQVVRGYPLITLA